MFNKLFDELSIQEIITNEQKARIIRNMNTTMQLLNVASSIRVWKNLDDSKSRNNIMSTNIQRALMLTGFCSFVEKDGEKYPLPFYPSTVPSLDFRPTKGVCVGYNGQTFNVDTLDGTPILKNTPYGWSALPAICEYSDRIEAIDTTTMGIINAMQVPYIITTPSKDTESILATRIANAIRNREPIVVADDAVGQTFDRYITVLNTNVNSEHISSLTTYRAEAFAQFMRYLGSVDLTGEKRERLLVGEVQLSHQSAMLLDNQFNISADENAELLSEYLGRKVTWEKYDDISDLIGSGNIKPSEYRNKEGNNVNIGEQINEVD